MFGFFGKKVSKKAVELKQASARIENKDLVEAVVMGSLLVAFRDGNCDDNEIKALEGVLSSDKQFETWQGQIHNMIADGVHKFSDGRYRIGKINALREISDLKNDPKNAELALVCIITVADSGDISPEERETLDEIAKALGLRLENYL